MAKEVETRNGYSIPLWDFMNKPISKIISDNMAPLNIKHITDVNGDVIKIIVEYVPKGVYVNGRE